MLHGLNLTAVYVSTYGKQAWMSMVRIQPSIDREHPIYVIILRYLMCSSGISCWIEEDITRKREVSASTPCDPTEAEFLFFILICLYTQNKHLFSQKLFEHPLFKKILYEILQTFPGNILIITAKVVRWLHWQVARVLLLWDNWHPSVDHAPPGDNDDLDDQYTNQIERSE